VTDGVQSQKDGGPSVDDVARSETGHNNSAHAAARPWFALVAFLMLIPAFLTCYFELKICAQCTLERDGNQWPDGRPVAADFIQFAAVAEAWELGRIDELYAGLARQQEFMTLAAELKRPYRDTLSFNYPPFYAWLLRPLAPLPYLHRFVVWSLMQFAFAVIALACWRKELGPRAFGIVALGWFLSPPVCNTLVLGHASFGALAAMSGTLYLLNRGRDFQAGLVLSLLLFKPTLGVVIGPMVIIAGRWKAVLGVAMGASLLLLASLAVSVQACKDYPKIGRELFHLATTHPDFYVRHFNWLGAVSTLLAKPPADFNWVRRAMVVIPIAMLLLTVAKAWCIPWRPGSPRWQAGAAAAVLATLFCTPYLYSYDTQLAGIAAVYSVATWRLRPEWHRWYILGCIFTAGYFICGDQILMAQMDKRLHVRIQLAPVAFAAWAILEAKWAMGREEKGVGDQGSGIGKDDPVQTR
jgi:hypothetical protein